MNKQRGWVRGLIILVILRVFCTSIPAWSVQEVNSRQTKKKPLPAGFLPVDGAAIHPSGWPLEVRCLKDNSVMVFVCGGEFNSGLTSDQLKDLAMLIREHEGSLESHESSMYLQAMRTELDKLKSPRIFSEQALENIREYFIGRQMITPVVANIERAARQIPEKDAEGWWKDREVVLKLTLTHPEFQSQSGLELNEEQAAWLSGFIIKAAKHPLEMFVGELSTGIRPHQKRRPGQFYIDKYEVTNRQYRLFMAEVKNEEHRPGITYYFPYSRKIMRQYYLWEDKKRNYDDQPVTCIFAESAAAYAKWAGKSLPSPLHWERAAVGDGGRVFPWGSDFKPDYCRCNCQLVRDLETKDKQKQESHKKMGRLHEVLELWETAREIRMLTWPVPADVGRYPHDISPFGCYDMGGNVSEWVQDGDTYALMGGSALSQSPMYIVPAMRMPYQFKSRCQGFRTVLPLDENR